MSIFDDTKCMKETKRKFYVFMLSDNYYIVTAKDFDQVKLWANTLHYYQWHAIFSEGLVNPQLILDIQLIEEIDITNVTEYHRL